MDGDYDSKEFQEHASRVEDGIWKVAERLYAYWGMSNGASEET